MKNNIVFLDIDGVLNQCQPNCYIDSLCLKVLIKICKKTESKVVLSSSWRVGFSNFGECSKEIQRLRDMLNEHGVEIIGRTSKLGNRNEEIQEYIKSHNVENYLIIDDDIHEFGNVRPDNLLLTNYKSGLTWNDYRIACNIFWEIYD